MSDLGEPGLLASLHPRAFLFETWRVLDREARAAPAGDPDPRPAIAFCVAALCLTLMQYAGGGRALDGLLGWLGWRSAVAASPWADMSHWVWWSGWRVIGYLILPALVVRWVFGQPLSDYGWRVRGCLTGHRGILGVFCLAGLGLVALAGLREDFVRYYPMCVPARESRAALALWAVLYAAQFVSLEFFFRGFLIEACKPALGSAAIFASALPYCMIHFGKPLPETIGAIAAGVILGTLALRTRSIWPGVALHVLVAWSMDLTALWRRGGLPTIWWPV